MSTLPVWPYPKLCAHRGAGKLAPENTLAAMRLGACFGYRMFEFDVKLSGDGSAVLMHDDTVDRTTHGSGRLAQFTLGELMRLDAGGWHSPGFTGEGIPTFGRVVRWLNAGRFMANVEVKPCPGRAFETGAAVALEAKVAFHACPVQPIISSFSPRSLEGARETAPHLARGLLFNDLPEDWQERCARLECVSIHPNYRTVTSEFIEEGASSGSSSCDLHRLTTQRTPCACWSWALIRSLRTRSIN